MLKIPVSVLTLCAALAPALHAEDHLTVLASDPRLELVMHAPTVVIPHASRTPFLFCTGQGTLVCQAEYNLYGGGTGGPTTHSACIAANTGQRVAELSTMYGWRLEK